MHKKSIKFKYKLLLRMYSISTEVVLIDGWILWLMCGLNKKKVLPV